MTTTFGITFSNNWLRLDPEPLTPAEFGRIVHDAIVHGLPYPGWVRVRGNVLPYGGVSLSIAWRQKRQDDGHVEVRKRWVIDTPNGYMMSPETARMVAEGFLTGLDEIRGVLPPEGFQRRNP